MVDTIERGSGPGRARAGGKGALVMTGVALAAVIGGYYAFWRYQAHRLQTAVDEPAAALHAHAQEQGGAFSLKYAAGSPSGFPFSVEVPFQRIQLHFQGRDARGEAMDFTAELPEIVVRKPVFGFASYDVTLPREMRFTQKLTGQNREFSVLGNAHPAFSIALDGDDRLSRLTYTDKGYVVVEEATDAMVSSVEHTAVTLLREPASGEEMRYHASLQLAGATGDMAAMPALPGELPPEVKKVLERYLTYLHTLSKRLGRVGVAFEGEYRGPKLFGEDVPRGKAKKPDKAKVSVKKLDIQNDMFGLSLAGGLQYDAKADPLPWGKTTLQLRNYGTLVDYYAAYAKVSAAMMRDVVRASATAEGGMKEAELAKAEGIFGAFMLTKTQVTQVKQALRELSDQPQTQGKDLAITLTRPKGGQPRIGTRSFGEAMQVLMPLFQSLQRGLPGAPKKPPPLAR